MMAAVHRTSPAIRALFLVALFAVVAWQDGLEVFETVSFQLARGDIARPGFNALVYAGTYLICVAAIAALLLHPWRWIRWLGFALVAAFSSVYVGFAAVNGTGFEYHEASLVLSELQFAPSALKFFAARFAGSVALGLVAWTLLALVGSRLALRRGGLALLVVPLVAGYAAIELTRQTFGKVYQLPAAVRVPVLTHWAYAHRPPFYGERAAPRLRPKAPPLSDHIIVVMDESVSGHWLGVNGATPDTTPWLSSAPRGVFNYGIASAISNLSSSSNLLLQTGLRADRLPDRELHALRDANVFAYMSAAGFRTAFIDAQSYSRRPSNLMTQFDIDALDAYWQLRQLEPALSEHAVDGTSLPLLREILASAPRSFSYVLKNGAHLPYSDKFPASRIAGPERWRASQTLREYLAAVQWSSDDYLQSLAGMIEASGEEVLVVYTSDHGQSLEEPGVHRTVTPHATEIDPPSAQASVPLLLLAFGERTRAAIAQRFDPELRDRISAFEIFPTLLESAGYAREDLQPDFAPSLFDVAARRGERVFASGNVFAREGDFEILNPGMGSACYLNAFQTPAPRAFLPADPDGSADTRVGGDRGTGTSPRGAGISST
jgi:glucan phosphoethanolaminetransferase (alkaline phosphatase superfamily)